MGKSCLIIIDMQTGIFHQKNGVFNSDTLISNIKLCIQHAFEQDMQVVITQHENKSSLIKGSEDWRVINSFQEFLSKSYVLEKKHPSIFSIPIFKMILKQMISHHFIFAAWYLMGV